MAIYQRYTDRAPKRKFTTGPPIIMLLLAMSMIAAYLLIAGALTSEAKHPVAIVLPTPAVVTSR